MSVLSTVVFVGSNLSKVQQFSAKSPPWERKSNSLSKYSGRERISLGWTTLNTSSESATEGFGSVII